MTQPSPLFGRTAVSQTEKAYCALEEMIVTGELPPGSQWSETTLSERVGIGRSPVRDALQKLAFQRLVEIAPRQGIFISEIDYQGQLKIIQARREIERLIVAQAAQWADDAERAELARLARELEDLKAVNDMRMYMRLHFSLTSQIGAASRNSYAAEFHAMLQTLARRFLYFHQKRHPDLVQICELHIQQINAIVEGSVERAIATAEARNDYAENLARNILMELIVTSAVTISSPPRGRDGSD
ncbi:GntR family transcriptional regulator [Achromobacter insolitus]|uniref:GntR family transcriptional regulator n=1 Tax=Achromobacter insolitus TaxID=217204 RepID=UPI0020A4D656|nr:GntR family transcriptional regulator [Achromobacter insolitus]MCP1403937.1 DNA-binding GntR family transcriptional regulator [Achromobacter insolitus]